MTEKLPETFDVEKVHDEQIAPLVDQIHKICRDNNIPFLISFQLTERNRETGGAYVHLVLDS